MIRIWPRGSRVSCPRSRRSSRPWRGRIRSLPTRARAYGEDDLPGEIRDAAFRLEPGQVSPVLEYAGAFLIFQLVRKMEAEEVDTSDLRRRVQLELFRKKGEQALERYIADLKKDTEIHVNRAVLPFEYSGEYRN